MNPIKIVALGLVLTVLAGCPRQPVDPNAPPPTPEQIQLDKQNRCETAILLTEAAKTAAVLSINEKTKQSVKDGISVSMKTADEAVGAYCTAILTDQPELQLVFRRTLSRVLQELQLLKLGQIPAPAS